VFRIALPTIGLMADKNGENGAEKAVAAVRDA
jgi:hypothetical protein